MGFSEMSKKTPETTEIKRPELKGYKDIKSEGAMSKAELKEFWKNEIRGENSGIEKAEKVYTDDNGEIYRIDDQLKPNTIYEINGYTYKTDDQGRIISAEGKLQIKNHEGKKTITDSREVVAHGEMKDSEERGHLIGDRFNGREDLGNLVPMDAKLNRGDYKKMENTLAAAVKEGADVRMKVEPVYDSNSYRPESFKVTYSIDGDKEVVVFKNGGGDNSVK